MMEKVKENAKRNGYFVCPDEELLKGLIEGLVKNEERYGYASCPCREASGIKNYDQDIICPCEYRAADIDEYGCCYCGLFVSEEIKENPSKLSPIPERRPEEIIKAANEFREKTGNEEKESYTDIESREALSGPPAGRKEEAHVWRCKVCGYLAARKTPPPVCPICNAKAEKFEKFDL